MNKKKKKKLPLYKTSSQGSKELKKISGKRTKTEEDHLRMSEIEFRAGLYWRDDIGVHMPADNLQAMFLAAAKKTRQGPKCNAIMIDDDMAIRFKNSTNLKKLERDESLYFRKHAVYKHRR